MDVLTRYFVDELDLMSRSGHGVFHMVWSQKTGQTRLKSWQDDGVSQSLADLTSPVRLRVGRMGQGCSLGLLRSGKWHYIWGARWGQDTTGSVSRSFALTLLKFLHLPASASDLIPFDGASPWG